MSRRRRLAIVLALLTAPLALCAGYALIREPTVIVTITNRMDGPTTDIRATFARQGDFADREPPTPGSLPVVVSRPTARREIGRIGPGESRRLPIPRTATAFFLVEFRDTSGWPVGAMGGEVLPEGHTFEDFRVNLVRSGIEWSYSSRPTPLNSLYWTLRSRVGL